MQIRTLGVVGAGTMGTGIAHVAAVAGFDVVLTDIEDGVLRRSLTLIGDALDRQIAKGSLKAEQRQEVLDRVHTSTHLSEQGRAGLIVESAEESFEIKAEIFRQLDARCPTSTVFASNTSSLSIGRMAAVTRRPERFVGMHFMIPVQAMQLVEVIRGLETSSETLEVVREVALRLGKTPVECRDFPGFVSNRVLMPMINEAIWTVYEGVATVESVDQIMHLGMNHPMGPLQLADLIGLDTCLKVMRMLHDGFGESKYRPCPLLVKMVEAGRLGRKTGRGFYTY